MFLVRWIGILLSRKLQNVMEAVENTEKESIGLGAAPCSWADVSRSHFLRPSFAIAFHPSPSLSRALFVSVLIAIYAAAFCTAGRPFSCTVTPTLSA